MKKSYTALLAALTAALALSTAAAEGVKIDGRIEAAETKTLLAPYSGIVGDFSVREGDRVQAGENLFPIKAQKIYADFDGTVTGLFAQPGDSAASVQDRYGALCYMERDTLYTADCNNAGADTDNENKIVHPGEPVFIRSTSNNNRQGEARVTTVNGKDFQIEVLSERDMRLYENVKVYRDERFTNSSCIGTGKLHRVDPVPVTAEGHVLAVHVEEGQKVQRGDLLFEIVPDALDDMQGGSGFVSMPEEGILLSISAASGTQTAKDAPLASYCPADALRLICSVDEDDLSLFAVGEELTVTLDAQREEPVRGEVVKIADAGAEQGAQSKFDVTIELEEEAPIRIGMNASAEKAE